MTRTGAGARRLPFAVLVLAIIGAGVTVLLALTTATAASEVRQRSLDAANADLRDKQQQLARDVAAKQAPQQLAEEAIRLGLVPAGNPAFIRVNADGSVTVLGSPAPVTPPPLPPKPTTPATKPPATKPPATKPPAARSTATKPARTTGHPTGGQPTTPPAAGGHPTSGHPSTPTPNPTPTTTVVLPGGPR